ncbi:pyroglutamyl-peptidase I [Brachybacterium timonense]|uniref:pyroglutamyl-peptidase I n=1 Tax=Brachybacterium timonense TaxID=2050896 RepID=UPI000D0B9CCA|nr:pyroglutamyl-peptidase I [Brachybacterium timonense]
MTTDVLLTGFAPFGGAATNESWEAVRAATPLLDHEGVRVVGLELPVEFARAGQILEEAIESHRPRVVIAVGLAAGRTSVTPERVAINVRDARIPDNAGASPVDEPCEVGGPVGRWSTLPIKAMVQATREDLDLPAAVSQSAGTYVCNDVFYLLMAQLERRADGTRGGFIHVPAATDLPVSETARALARMTQVALTQTQDVALAAGSEH